MVSNIFKLHSSFQENEDILLFWQKKIFKFLFATLLFAGILPYLLSVRYAFKTSQWHTIFVFTFVYIIGFCIVFIKKIPFPTRVWIGLVAFYALGVFSLLNSGLVGSGRLYLMCFSTFAVIFSNFRGGLIALAINLFTLLIFGLFFSKGLYLTVEWADTFNLQIWLICTATFTLVCSAITISLAVLIQALQINSKEFRNLIRNTSQIIWTLNNELELTFINAPLHSILGYHQGEWIGLPLNCFLNKKDGNTFNDMIRNEKPFSFEATIQHKDGTPIPVKISGTKIKELTKSKNIYQGSIEDIREQKKHEKEKNDLIRKLNQAEKLKSLGLLAGTVAHDLNNILSGIATYPEVLLMDAKLDPEIEKGLNVIKESGQKASDVVSDLLTISRGSHSEKEIININSLLERYTRAHDFTKIQSTYPNVSIKLKTEPELLNIYGSYIHLEKTVMNLLINAVEEVSGKPDGRVMISTTNAFLDSILPGHENRIQGEYVVLRVSDNGSGISEKNKLKIFDPFYTKKTMGKSGTGLGLTVVWNTVQDHNGYIDVESDPTGTVFELFFPATREAIKAQAKRKESLDEIRGNGEMILVVDDLADQQDIALSILTNLGYQAKAVGNGHDAVDFVQNTHTDLVILDMIMAPSISGLETYRMIKKVNPGQKAIIASGFAESDDVQAAQHLGAGSFVKKPYTILDMGIAIKEELEK